MKLVIVKWLDARGVGDEWDVMNEEAKGQRPPVHIESAGWLFEDAPGYVVIVPHVGKLKGHKHPQGCGHMTIPKASILSMKKLVVMEEPTVRPEFSIEPESDEEAEYAMEPMPIDPNSDWLVDYAGLLWPDDVKEFTAAYREIQRRVEVGRLQQRVVVSRLNSPGATGPAFRRFCYGPSVCRPETGPKEVKPPLGWVVPLAVSKWPADALEHTSKLLEIQKRADAGLIREPQVRHMLDPASPATLEQFTRICLGDNSDAGAT